MIFKAEFSQPLLGPLRLDKIHLRRKPQNSSNSMTVCIRLYDYLYIQLIDTFDTYFWPYELKICITCADVLTAVLLDLFETDRQL